MTVAPATPDQKRQLWAVALTVGFLLLAALQIFLISLRQFDYFSLEKRPMTAAWCFLALPYTLLACAAVVMALYTRIAGVGKAVPVTRRLLELALWGTPIIMVLGYLMRRETIYRGGHMVPIDIFFDDIQGLVIPGIMGFYCVLRLFALRRELRKE